MPPQTQEEKAALTQKLESLRAMVQQVGAPGGAFRVARHDEKDEEYRDGAGGRAGWAAGRACPLAALPALPGTPPSPL